MSFKRKKICLLFCGGSVLLGKEDKFLVVQKKSDIKKWMEEVRELNLLAQLEPVFIFGEDASEIKPELWIKLAREIEKRFKKYDGFVIIHGLDTILYTASMLSFMLQNLSKPVILTGSPLSSKITGDVAGNLVGLIQDYKGLGVKANLINAIQVATMDLAEVSVMAGNRLVRGNQAVRSGLTSLNFFDPFRLDNLGRVDFGMKLYPHSKKRSKSLLKLNTRIDAQVHLLELYPGVPPEFLEEILERGYHGVLIRTFSANLFPEDFKPVLKKAHQKKVAVVAYNPQSIEIKKPKPAYITVRELTLETALTKLMWALGQTRNLEKIRKIMTTNLVGELDKIKPG